MVKCVYISIKYLIPLLGRIGRARIFLPRHHEPVPALPSIMVRNPTVFMTPQSESVALTSTYRLPHDMTFRIVPLGIPACTMARDERLRVWPPWWTNVEQGG